MCMLVFVCLCVSELESFGVTVFLQVSEDALRIFQSFREEFFSLSLCVLTVQRSRALTTCTLLTPPMHNLTIWTVVHS